MTDTQTDRQTAAQTDPRTLPHRPPTDRQILSQAECQAILAHLGQRVTGTDIASARIWSDWVAGVRWGRNQILDAQSTTQSTLEAQRFINGAEGGGVVINETTGPALDALMQRAERLTMINAESLTGDLGFHRPLETPLSPALFDEATYQQGGETRVAAAGALIQQAAAAGMYSAGYIEVSAHSLAMMDTLGRACYFRYTWAQCSVTVRDPAGTGSGWAGVDWPAWDRITPAELGTIALDKCLRSRNPVRVEPGRYTTILEPQAVFDLVSPVFGMRDLNRDYNEGDTGPPFLKDKAEIGDGMGGVSKLGDRIMDPRITISADPMDPELGTPPFRNIEEPDRDFHFYSPITFVKDGVLTELPYDSRYAAVKLGRATSRDASGAFRMSGGTTTLAEMIASTTRGILVTRFSDIQMLNSASGLVRGYTRDGTWFIENGKITKPIVNLTATESSLFILNNVEQLGVPQRVFNPPYTWNSVWGAQIPSPAIVPLLKVRDFSFTALVDAV